MCQASGFLRNRVHCPDGNIMVYAATFINLGAESGGAIYLQDYNTLYVLESVFSQCAATKDSGGAIYISGSHGAGHMSHTCFFNCSAAISGGCFVILIVDDQPATFQLDGVSVYQCSSPTHGARIHNPGFCQKRLNFTFNKGEMSMGFSLWTYYDPYLPAVSFSLFRHIKTSYWAVGLHGDGAGVRYADLNNSLILDSDAPFLTYLAAFEARLVHCVVKRNTGQLTLLFRDSLLIVTACDFDFQPDSIVASWTLAETLVTPLAKLAWLKNPFCVISSHRKTRMMHQVLFLQFLSV